VKWKGGKNVENAPYSEHIEMLKELSRKVPVFKSPEIAQTPEKKKELLNQIRNKQHPDTVEGVVEYDLNAPGGDPKKVKLRDTHEVVIRSIFPAISPKPIPFAGGFEYSWEPEGPVVGRVGTGFSQKMREEMLADPKKFLGRIARIKTQQVFESGAARAPSFYSMHVEKNLEKVATPKGLFTGLAAGTLGGYLVAPKREAIGSTLGGAGLGFIAGGGGKGIALAIKNIIRNKRALPAFTEAVRKTTPSEAFIGALAGTGITGLANYITLHNRIKRGKVIRRVAPFIDDAAAVAYIASKAI
jgi:hypothetical protein